MDKCLKMWVIPSSVIVNKQRRFVDVLNMAKKHPCNMCVKSCISASQLATHFLTHTGEKSHKCAECNKSFSQASNLKTHMLTHTGEMKHTCAQCDKFNYVINNYVVILKILQYCRSKKLKSITCVKIK